MYALVVATLGPARDQPTVGMETAFHSNARLCIETSTTTTLFIRKYRKKSACTHRQP